ncbi:MAG TPA: hypothetical protein PLN64_00930 [Candidatus Bipolaricaulis anaerobius]|nr:hypothetical protein [Candidatus Bipolaricaulis anaerobius]
MSLHATTWREDRFLAVDGEFSEADDFCQGVAEVSVKTGWYVSPAGGEEFCIQREVTQTSHSGRIIRYELERYEYEIPGSPPRRRTAEVWGCVYLPGRNPGRGYIKLEEEVEELYPWNGFTPGANLSRIRRTSGYVIYDLATQRTSRSAEGEQKLADRDQTSGSDPRLIVDSARTWREAISDGGIIEETDEPQVAHWVDPFETETEWVTEEPDKYTILTTTQSHIRPNDVRRDGPRYQKKEGYTYRLPVPLSPPVLSASADGDGIRVEVKGGGADLWGRFVPPDRYRILRRTVSGGDRGAATDPNGIWDDDPAEDDSRRIVIDTGYSDFDGDPIASPLPTASTYTEPGDTSEPVDDGWVVVAEVDNVGDRRGQPYGKARDEDVVTGAVYEYVAQAIVGRDESDYSNTASVTYGGASRSSGIRPRVTRNAETGAVEVDILGPEAANILEAGYGDTITLDVPIELTIDLLSSEDGGEGEDGNTTRWDESAARAFGVEVGTRYFAKYGNASLEATLEVAFPLLTVERGLLVSTPDATWRTIGNLAQIESQIDPNPWLVDGFRLSAAAGKDGKLEGITSTTLYVVQP